MLNCGRGFNVSPKIFFGKFYADLFVCFLAALVVGSDV